MKLVDAFPFPVVVVVPAPPDPPEPDPPEPDPPEPAPPAPTVVVEVMVPPEFEPPPPPPFEEGRVDANGCSIAISTRRAAARLMPPEPANEPTITPKASIASTATAIARGDAVCPPINASPLIGSGSSAEIGSSVSAGSEAAGSSALRSGEGPRRVPHSTQ